MNKEFVSYEKAVVLKALRFDEPWNKETHHYKHTDEVINKLKEAVKSLKQAKIYVTRVDWLLSGDDNETTFFKRLDEELKELETDFGQD